MSQHQQLSPEMQAAIARGPPYPSMMATSGSQPNVTVDVPIVSVLLFLYASSAAINMFVFQRNRRRGIIFIPTVLLFGFSMARVLTCILRIVWATMPQAASTALAAQIFVNAGILIVYIINFLFMQRIVRALHPRIGWHPVARIVPRVFYALLGCALVLIIVFIVYGSYTLSESFHHAQLWTLRGVSIYLLVFTAAPLFIIPLAFLLPRSKNAEHFGEGSMISKAAIVLTTTALCTTIAGFRAGTNWMPPRPITNPAWYHSKAAFYCFNFMLEIFVLVIYTSVMMHKRFAVPDGSSKRKTYKIPDSDRPGSAKSEGTADDGGSDVEKQKPNSLDSTA